MTDAPNTNFNPTLGHKEEQNDVLADRIDRLADSVTALKDEMHRSLTAFREETGKGLSDFRVEMQRSSTEFRTTLQQGLSDFRAEMQRSMSDFRVEVQRSHSEFRADLADLKILIEKQAEASRRQTETTDRLIQAVEQLVNEKR